MAVAAQFCYVAAQTGIFSFFINCMTPNARTGFCIVPPVPEALDSGLKTIASHLPAWDPLQNWLNGWFEIKEGVRRITDAGASALQSIGFVCFLAGRVFGSWLLKKYSAHKVLGTFRYSQHSRLLLDLPKSRLGVDGLHLPEFLFHVDHVPDHFRAGHFRSGARAKKASAYIVMAIMGGAILPKLMGYVADQYDMSRGFIVPIFCFGFVALYSFLWPKLANAESLRSTAKGH